LEIKKNKKINIRSGVSEEHDMDLFFSRSLMMAVWS
jgi:hypothetical protein